MDGSYYFSCYENTPHHDAVLVTDLSTTPNQESAPQQSDSNPQSAFQVKRFSDPPPYTGYCRSLTKFIQKIIENKTAIPLYIYIIKICTHFFIPWNTKEDILNVLFWTQLTLIIRTKQLKHILHIWNIHNQISSFVFSWRIKHMLLFLKH